MPRPTRGNALSKALLTRLVLTGLLALLLAATFQVPQNTVASAAGRAGSGPRPANRPNVVLITTDDQTLADLRYMPRTRRLIGDRGVSFQGISPHPLCCPARAEILTGQFAQNNGVRSNTGKYGGYKRLRPRHTIATWMRRAGYHTILMGKYLNGYLPRFGREASRGWADWNPTIAGVYDYFDFTVSHNRTAKRYRRYQTDYFTDLAVTKIRQAARMRRPFFLWQSYVAPHHACPPSMETTMCWVPPAAAPRHRGMFLNATSPARRSAAFNAEVSNKPFPLNTYDAIDDDHKRRLTRLHRNRLRSLQAVDEGVARMVRSLRRSGELANTLIIFTSDNGYLLGEHRYMGKVLPYEPSLQIPLLMRGPGLPKGVVRDRVATLIDLAPTIAAVGRAEPSLVMDGRNLYPVAIRDARSWETLLVQAGPHRVWAEDDGWFYRGVRTDRYTFAYYPHKGEYELYDRAHDPHQLNNLADDRRYRPVFVELQRRAAVLERCSGRQCRRSFGPLPLPTEAETPPTEEPTDEPADGPADGPTDGPTTGQGDEPESD